MSDQEFHFRSTERRRIRGYIQAKPMFTIVYTLMIQKHMYPSPEAVFGLFATEFPLMALAYIVRPITKTP